MTSADTSRTPVAAHLARRWRTRIATGVLLGIALTAASALVAAPGIAAAGDDAPGKELPSPREMKRLVKQSIVSGDEASLIEVLGLLARIEGREPAQAVLDIAVALPEEEEHWYWMLLEGLCAFKRPEAYTEIGEYIARNRARPVARDLLHALAPNRSKYVNRVIRRVLERGTLDLQLMALDLAQNIHVRRTVDVLMPIYEEEDESARATGKNSPLKDRLVATLEVLTLRHFGDSLPNWQSFWAANRHKGLKVLRDEAEADRPSTGIALPLDPLREKEWVGMEDLPNGRVLVIKGETARNGFNTNFDDFSQTLERFGVKHDVVVKDRLLEPGFSIDRYAAVFINCTQINEFCQSPGHTGGEAVGNRLRRCLGPAPHDTFRGKMKPEAIEKLRKWVMKGGYLFTQDWALYEVLEPAFPKFVHSGTKLEDGTVTIRPAKGQTSHYLLRGVFVPPVKIDAYEWIDEDDEDDEPEEYDPALEDDPGDGEVAGGRTRVGEEDKPDEPVDIEDVEVKTVRHKWKIDNESPSIEVRSKKVRVLIHSSDLKRDCGNPAVAITFDPGKGRVVHVLSHFGKQNSSQDEATLTNFVVNFLIDVKVKVMGGKN